MMNMLSKGFCWMFGACFFTGLFCLSGQAPTAKWELYLLDQKATVGQNEGNRAASIGLITITPDTGQPNPLSNFTVLRRLDPSHYIILLPKSEWKELSKNHVLEEVNHLWKLSDVLLKNTDTRASNFLIKSLAPEQTLLFLRQSQNVSLQGVFGNYIQVYGRQDDVLEELLPKEEVLFIGKESLLPQLESSVLDLNPSINNIPKFQKALGAGFGEDLILSLKDNLFFLDDIDLIDKMVASPLAATTTDAHATDMATIMAGLGNSSIKGRGVAPEAKIRLSDFQNLFPDSSNTLSGDGIFVQNHSYGTEIENFYGALAEAYDQHVHDHPMELHVFSAGNVGEQVATDGQYGQLGPYANLTGNFKMAKNILTVGAVDEGLEPMAFSSKGPAYDGRVKPELVAYSIIGTSNAAALTSAVAGVLQEKHQKLYGVAAPAALIKAFLVGGADDLGNLGPDFDTGYGNLNAYAALQLQQRQQFLVDSVAVNTAKTFTITVPEQSRNVKITLVWTDVPANVNDQVALVNDLDLSVVTTTQTHLPWVLDSSPNTTALKAATTGIDRLNTIEQVFIPNPTPGSLQIEVTAFQLQSPYQKFALAYSWEDADNFAWNYPLSGDNLPYDGETPTYLRWNSNLDTQDAVLSVSYDNGAHWETIATDIALKKRFHFWSPPEDVNTSALLKMVDGEKEFISEPFLISRANQLSVGLNCDDTLGLQWNPSVGAQSYMVYSILGDSLGAIAQVRDTSFVIQRTPTTNPYFAIRPQLGNGQLGIQSETLDSRDFPPNCYESFLLAETNEDTTAITLEVALSSTFNVAELVIEKKVGATFSDIGRINDLNGLLANYTDSFPQEGLNTYRLKTILADGTVFISEETELVFLSEMPFLTFPNPIADGVNIISKDFREEEALMAIYGMDGRFIFSEAIQPGQNFIALDQLPSGVYAMILVSSAGDSYSKLVNKL